MCIVIDNVWNFCTDVAINKTTEVLPSKNVNIKTWRKRISVECDSDHW